MKTILTIILTISVFILNAQNEVYIQYGLELLPNHPNPEKFDIADEIILNRETTELNKNQDDFYRLEMVYLSGLAASNKNVSKYDELFDLFSFEEVQFMYKKNNEPYLKISVDTIFNFQEYSGGLKKSLINNQHVVTSLVEKFDKETGDPVFDFNGDPIYEEVEERFDLRDVLCAIDFKESWEISKNGFFNKDILMYAPSVPFSQEGSYIGNSTLPYTQNGTEKSKQLFKSVEYDVMIGITPEVEEERKLAYDRLFYPSSEYFLYPESRKKLLTPLMNDINSGNIVIYQLNKGMHEIKDDSLRNEIFSETTLVVTLDDYGEPIYDMNTGDPVYVEVRWYYRSNDVVGFRFIEDWFLDEISGSFIKDIRFYAPLVYEKDETGNVDGIKPLFWIKGAN